MRISIIIILCQVVMLKSYAQFKSIGSPEQFLRAQSKVSFVNPGFEIEMPQSLNTTINIHLGVGYGGSYPDLTEGFESGFQYLIAPFADIQYRYYYSRKKRLKKNKFNNNNTGSFVAYRGLIRGKEFTSSFIRTSNIDFAFGIIGWGVQHYKNRFGWSFSVVPYYYFDDIGNIGFFL